MINHHNNQHLSIISPPFMPKIANRKTHVKQFLYKNEQMFKINFVI